MQEAKEKAIPENAVPLLNALCPLLPSIVHASYLILSSQQPYRVEQSETESFAIETQIFSV